MNSSNGKEMTARIGGKSTKSGGFMRAAPFGLYPDIQNVIECADIQARVTHDSWVGRNSAIGAALMTHYFYYDLGLRHELSGWLRDRHFGDTIHSPRPFEVDGEWVTCWAPGRRVGVHGWDCLEASIYAIEEHDNMADILQQCIAYTGDVDTVAAVAMAAASCAKDIKQNLPYVLVEKLENGPYGRDFLVDLDKKLKEKFNG
jgi:ADP-ribosylglycohydrolase